MIFAIAAVILPSSQVSTQLMGRDVGVRVVASNGELVQELVVHSATKGWIPVLVSPTDPLVKSHAARLTPNELGMEGGMLFSSQPTFAFEDVKVGGRTLTLTSDTAHSKIEESLTVPAEGTEIQVSLKAHIKDPNPRIQHFLATYAFAPGTPDSTWAPGLRIRDDAVIGDHFFRSPAVVAQQREVSAILMPDLDVLAENRPIPTILDLDCKPKVGDKPLLSYGFADYRLVSHVQFAHDSSMARPVPANLQLGFKIRLSADMAPYSAYEQVATEMWATYGHRFFDKILPQAMPFADYAKVCYPAAIGEKMTGGWFEATIDGQVCGGMPAGWGLEQGWVSWQDWFNQLRSAWGMHWWGAKLGNPDWTAKSNKMLNLALAAPMDRGACPTTYDSRNHTWKGSLITPTKDCYYDLTNIAWKGLWLQRWLSFPDCPRRSEIESQLKAMADLLMSHQQPDGSFPTWLAKDLTTVPMLDRSAQSALPGWFLAEWSIQTKDQAKEKAKAAALKTADFLAAQVVDLQRYYDFETFFSCSPKVCLQKQQVVDDPKMMDPHTLQRPQNTLSMQWTAEALRSAAKLSGDNRKYMDSALKALDTMCLYQNVWPISYRRIADTYGGFGVQNSDGEYNDARQSQFGETLCDFGVQLGRQDLFERGVAAVRASLTLINHPLHQSLGIYPNPNYPTGLEPENDGHGGSDEQDGRTGFDWGEGSGLAGIAAIMDKYGSRWSDPHGWSVLVDGVSPNGPAPAPRDPIQAPLLNPRFDLSDWRMKGWTFEGDFLHWAGAFTRMNFGNSGTPFIGTAEDGSGGYDDNFTGTITSPPFKVTGSNIELLVGGGAGPGEYVELIDETGKQLFAEHGQNRETMDKRTWNVANLKGKVLRIRIVDSEKEGWGHINVGQIRCTG